MDEALTQAEFHDLFRRHAKALQTERESRMLEFILAFSYVGWPMERVQGARRARQF
jgi:hypothetical protein